MGGSRRGIVRRVRLFVSELDEAAAARLVARARRHGRSLEAEARAILEEAASGSGFEEAAGEKDASLAGVEEKGFGDLMYERFKDIGLTEDEVRRFNNGIAAFSSRWEMSLPDFQADEYEESPSK
jgi:plasmid stability protein